MAWKAAQLCIWYLLYVAVDRHLHKHCLGVRKWGIQ